MTLDSAINNLDYWGALLFAFVPVVFISLVILPIGFRLKPETDDSSERGRLFSLVAAAFAFIVAFSTNTLWTQAQSVAESARIVGQSADEMVQAAQNVSDDLAAEVTTQLVSFDSYSQTNDINAGISDGSTGVRGVLDELSTLLTTSDVSTADTTSAYDAFHDSYKQYLLDLNAPSIPNLILLVIVVIGVVMGGVIASSPKSGSALSSRILLALSVFVIGLYQFPLWVLSSRKIVLNAVHPYLTPTDSEIVPSGVGFNDTAVLLVGAIVVIALLFVLPELIRRRRERDVRVDSDDGSPTVDERPRVSA